MEKEKNWKHRGQKRRIRRERTELKQFNNSITQIDNDFYFMCSLATHTNEEHLCTHSFTHFNNNSLLLRLVIVVDVAARALIKWTVVRGSEKKESKTTVFKSNLARCDVRSLFARKKNEKNILFESRARLHCTVFLGRAVFPLAKHIALTFTLGAHNYHH